MRLSGKLSNLASDVTFAISYGAWNSSSSRTVKPSTLSRVPIHRPDLMIAREAKVAQHRRPLGSKPDVPGLEVAMDDAVLVRVVQRQRHLLGRRYGLVDRQPVPISVRERLLHLGASHQARDDE